MPSIIVLTSGWDMERLRQGNERMREGGSPRLFALE
jgi:hypothetical protein